MRPQRSASTRDACRIARRISTLLGVLEAGATTAGKSEATRQVIRDGWVEWGEAWAGRRGARETHLMIIDRIADRSVAVSLLKSIRSCTRAHDSARVLGAWALGTVFASSSSCDAMRALGRQCVALSGAQPGRMAVRARRTFMTFSSIAAFLRSSRFLSTSSIILASSAWPAAINSDFLSASMRPCSLSRSSTADLQSVMAWQGAAAGDNGAGAKTELMPSLTSASAVTGDNSDAASSATGVTTASSASSVGLKPVGLTPFSSSNNSDIVSPLTSSAAHLDTTNNPNTPAALGNGPRFSPPPSSWLLRGAHKKMWRGGCEASNKQSISLATLV